VILRIKNDYFLKEHLQINPEIKGSVGFKAGAGIAVKIKILTSPGIEPWMFSS
jgi:hypothetical protein